MDPDENTQVDTTPVESTGGESLDTTTSQEPSGGNPAWEPLRNELDPVSFQRIQKHLKDMDSSANQRITSLNEQYKWAKELQDRQVQPDRINAAVSFAEQLDSNPLQVYEQLKRFLTDNGQLAAELQGQEQLDDDEDDGDDDQQYEDPRFAQLEQQQQRMQEFLNAQEHEKQTTAINNQVGTELRQLEESRKDLSRPDIAEILRYAAAQTETNRLNGGKIVTISDATAWFDSFRTRILSAPRAADSAPRLLPTNGGVPTPQGQKSTSQMTSAEIQALVAGTLQSGRSQ